MSFQLRLALRTPRGESVESTAFVRSAAGGESCADPVVSAPGCWSPDWARTGYGGYDTPNDPALPTMPRLMPRR